MQLHAIQTGTVLVKESWRKGRGHGVVRNLHAIFDRPWTPPLPIYAWVIEHPEGLIVVDTGETARASQPGYFPGWYPAPRFAVREMVTPDDEIGPQLQRIGLSAGDVRWVVMTHLHTDHAGGLHHFPHAQILVGRTEYHLARGNAGKRRGYVPQHWPAWFDPQLIDLSPQPIGPFPKSYAVTQAGDVILIPTPGHTLGHLSVVVREGDQAIVFAGDLSYTQDLLLQQAIDGVATHESFARQSLQRMAAFARTTPIVYLPSHDPDAAQRLAERSPIRFSTNIADTMSV